MSLEQRWNEVLDQLRKQDRFRSFRVGEGHDFTSNDYLGYANSSIQAPIHNDSDPTWGRSGTASRLLRGHHAVWDELECRLANWHQADAVLMMTSGYSANEGLISTIMEPGDWVATDELNHACIVDGLRLAKCRRFNYRHNDLNQLEEGLKKEASHNDPDRQRFIITESLFSMDGDLADLTGICALAEKYGAHVIVDEAHSTGCYGGTGSGYVDQLGLRKRILASIHTGGKAMAAHGAYIATSKLLKDYLINRCRHLIFTTSLPPLLGRWWLDSLAKVNSDPQSRAALHTNNQFFRNALVSKGFKPAGTEYIVPIIVGEDKPTMEVARALQQNGFDVRGIRPPSVPPGTARLRISVHADHPQELLSQLVNLLVQLCPR
ncbi:MAG: 8-amino-7-oxononanoate synthase [Zavarzinella sp.]